MTEGEGECMQRMGEITEGESVIITEGEGEIITEGEGENTERDRVKTWTERKNEYLERRRLGKKREIERGGEVGERIESERKRWGERTEEWLCDAAMRGDVESLKEIIKIDEYILDKVLLGSFRGKNPVHVATSTGQREFVLELLEVKEDLAKALDPELGTALHVASTKGDCEIATLLAEISPGMCLARDREGNNPLHIAAMQGKVEVLKVLLQISTHAARVKVDRGDTILHLCANYNQFESLKLLLEMVGDKEFVNSIDSNGNNILHLAIFGKRVEIVELVLGYGKIDVNARNGSDWTALDIYYKEIMKDGNARNGCDWALDWIVKRCSLAKDSVEIFWGDGKEDGKEDGREDGNVTQGRGWFSDWKDEVFLWVGGKTEMLLKKDGKEDGNGEYDRIEKALREKNAKIGKQLFSTFEPEWVKKKKETLMIVSSLIATIAFQVGVNPPGGVWQDNTQDHVAGKAITAYNYPNAYRCFMYINTIGFLLSLSTILELIAGLPAKYKFMKFIRSMILWMTIMATAFAYTFSVTVVSPADNYEKSVSRGVLVIVIVWAAVVTFFTQVPFRFRVLILGVLWVLVQFLLVVSFCLVSVIVILLVEFAQLVGCGLRDFANLVAYIVRLVGKALWFLAGLIVGIGDWIRSRWSQKKAHKTNVLSELPT